MTEILWAVVISACVAMFATFVVMIVILMALGLGTSIWTDIIVSLTYVLMVAATIAGLWLAVILDDMGVRIVAAILGSALLTVDALVVLGIIQRLRDHRTARRFGS